MSPPVEHLSSDEFLSLWSDENYRAKRKSEAERNVRFAPCCNEIGCVCGQAAQLAAEFENSPVIFMDRGYFCMEAS